MAADAADRNNRTYSQLGAEILEEAEATDAAEDERFGDKRGGELPPELADRNTRRARLREAKRQLDAERQAQIEEMAAWEQTKADYIERTGKGQGWPTKPRPIPAEPTRRINITDPDSRSIKTARGFIQGYTAKQRRPPRRARTTSTPRATRSIRASSIRRTTTRWPRARSSATGARSPARARRPDPVPDEVFTTDLAGALRVDNGARDIGAYEFQAVFRTLTVNKAGTGDGTVTGAPGAISCGLGCTSDNDIFEDGQSVTLTQVPSGSSPAVWSGCNSVIAGNQCIVAMTANRAVTATFTALPPPPTGKRAAALKKCKKVKKKKARKKCQAKAKELPL